MSKFIYSRTSEDTVNDKKVKKEEFIKHDAKGLTFRFLHYNSSKKIYLRISGKLSNDGKVFNVTMKEDGKDKVTKDIKIGDLKKIKELKFVTNYIAKDMAKIKKGLEGGKRRKSRKSTKKKKSRKRRTSRKRKSSRRKSRK